MSVPLRARSKVPNQEVSVKRRRHGGGNAVASAKEVEAVRGAALGKAAGNRGHLRSSDSMEAVSIEGHDDVEAARGTTFSKEACGYGQTACGEGLGKSDTLGKQLRFSGQVAPSLKAACKVVSMIVFFRRGERERPERSTC